MPPLRSLVPSGCSDGMGMDSVRAQGGVGLGLTGTLRQSAGGCRAKCCRVPATPTPAPQPFPADSAQEGPDHLPVDAEHCPHRAFSGEFRDQGGIEIRGQQVGEIPGCDAPDGLDLAPLAA